ncbi:DUF167 family protein [Thiohalobacter sp.]|uniref:DUF167 family protein n=1 Tax=Thiohalobacter sp. TaxID=2025948 RepID=UPI00260F73C6|nr:DUF167 family protein [Thiohalobacter sp.]
MGKGYRWVGEDLVLELHVQPGARRSGFAGLHGDRLKLRIQAPPVEGKANVALLRFLAEACAVPVSRVALERGSSGRHKRVRVTRPERCPPGVSLPPA